MKQHNKVGLAQRVIGICLFLILFALMIPLVALFGMVRGVIDYCKEIFSI
jgi:hypothetical protein